MGVAARYDVYLYCTLLLRHLLLLLLRHLLHLPLLPIPWPCGGWGPQTVRKLKELRVIQTSAAASAAASASLLGLLLPSRRLGHDLDISTRHFTHPLSPSSAST